MTFCVGIRVDEGIVALADTRITRGSRISSKSKLSALEFGDRPAFVMTSGLRSIRDKAVLRLEDRLGADDIELDRLHQLATMFGDELRAVRAEDESSITDAGLTFDLNAIIAGQFAGDAQPTMFHVYPEGNWVETTLDTPALLIGRTTYGAPILDRLLTNDTPLEQAIGLAYLAFDATRESVSDVDFPVDVVVLPSDGAPPRVQRFERAELDGVHDWWHRQLADALVEFPLDWAANLLNRGDVQDSTA